MTLNFKGLFAQRYIPTLLTLIPYILTSIALHFMLKVSSFRCDTTQPQLNLLLSACQTFQRSSESAVYAGPGEQGAGTSHGSPLCLRINILQVNISR